VTQTASLWPDVQTAYRWVHQAAHLLTNDEQRDGTAVQRRLCGLLGAMARHQNRAGTLAPALAHFRKVTTSYWPGLLHCYSVPDLPRTHNALEQCFGAPRYHARLTTGRKVASPALVLRGGVRLVASAATRICPFTSQELTPETVNAWHELHQHLETRRYQRTLRRRFRCDPVSYLAKLEVELLQLILPP
jgi:hypothetical protein